MRQYDQDFVVEEQEYRQQEAYKKREEKIDIDQDVLEVIKPVINKLTGKKPEQPVKEREKTTQEVLVNNWMKQFDTIYFKKESKGAIKMIHRFGKWMDVNAWLNHKLEQYKRIHENAGVTG